MVVAVVDTRSVDESAVEVVEDARVIDAAVIVVNGAAGAFDGATEEVLNCLFL